MADVIAKRSAKLENLYVFNVLCKLEVVQWIKGAGGGGGVPKVISSWPMPL